MLVRTGPIVISGSTQIAGPKKLRLMRIGEAPPKDVADEAKRVMITIWNKKMAKKVTQHEGQCLWGMTEDIMKVLAALGLPAELGGELAIALFKYARSDWQALTSAAKLEAEGRPKYKPRYYDQRASRTFGAFGEHRSTPTCPVFNSTRRSRRRLEFLTSPNRYGPTGLAQARPAGKRPGVRNPSGQPTFLSVAPRVSGRADLRCRPVGRGLRTGFAPPKPASSTTARYSLIARFDVGSNSPYSGKGGQGEATNDAAHRPLQRCELAIS
jgi:hypothetical protein